ncbi:hypothetical protein [Devosia sp. Root436]|uniref:DUF6950 family protein n=1 Tax=Devosia sp. Root436 TaxID=1736537 RepID=UPI0012E35F25|nr:hypothetical protein [Devosia sp. Root436]
MSRAVVRIIRRHHGEDGLVERMARLETFIRLTHSRPFEWGTSDCSLMVADWCVENGHEDPASAWRGTYTTEAECRALIAQRGDLAAVVAACAAMARLKVLAEPELGAVAVVGSKSNPDRQWSAIWNGRRWMVRWQSRSGPMWSPFVVTPLGIWRV